MPTEERSVVRAGSCYAVILQALICGILAAPAHADELWVAPTTQQDFGGFGVGSNVFWPATAFGVVRLALSVPNNFQTFLSAKVALISDAPGGEATLNVFVCAAEHGDLVVAACAGPFEYSFAGVASRLAEVDVSAAVASRVGSPGAGYLTILAYTSPTTTTDHIVGLRFAYDPVPASGVATLGANTFAGTQTAPAFVGDGSGLTNLPIPFGVATDVTCLGPCIDSFEIADGTIANADINAAAQIAPTKIAGTAATLGANAFSGTQSILGGNLGVGTAAPVAKLDVVGNTKVSGGLAVGGVGVLASLTARGSASFVATGTVSVSTVSITVTGAGTNFLSELQVGDRLLVGAGSRPVTSIASNTSLTVSAGFPADLSGAQMTVFPAIARLDGSSGASQVLVTDQGNLQLGSVYSSTNKLIVLQANRFAGTSSDNTITRANALVITTGPQGADVGPIVGLAGLKGGTSVMFAGVRGAKENAVFDDSRGYLSFYTVDAASMFAERARIDSTGNLGVGTAGPTQRLEVNGGIRLNTVVAQPVCDPTIRGTFWVRQQAPGLDDAVEACVKNAADAYVWRSVF